MINTQFNELGIVRYRDILNITYVFSIFGKLPSFLPVGISVAYRGMCYAIQSLGDGLWINYLHFVVTFLQ